MVQTTIVLNICVLRYESNKMFCNLKSSFYELCFFFPWTMLSSDNHLQAPAPLSNAINSTLMHPLHISLFDTNVYERR